MGRPDFKPGEGRLTFLVGSTPTHFRQSIAARAAEGYNGATQGGPEASRREAGCYFFCDSMKLIILITSAASIRPIGPEL